MAGENVNINGAGSGPGLPPRHRPPAGLAEAVHTQTEGNPLFVTEVVRLLVQEGELTQESGARDSWTVR